ncbi:hypothetical protein BD626DRAFT_476441 [Schizophyllum amplum]|uniref:BTB domain-containing protein n=1 Tax=Schizophyllum amplum TaxID=97359 RepID=A0A550CZD4_9AGAR|nr:hypothetical protein BD626DRAFT_476441 [Auriculariopsis ampla]
MSSNERFWFPDGSLTVRAQGTSFKIHHGLLKRHSRLSFDQDDITLDNVQAEDLIVLLEHLYHDVPLSRDAPFPRLAAMLRVTSPSQLDLPKMYDFASNLFADTFSSGPQPFTHPEDDLVAALALARELEVDESIRKGLLYSLLHSDHFHLEGDASIAASDKAVLDRLLASMVDHITPTLFTPAATPHRACTDVFADTWMDLVISPALLDGGVGRPLETLERMKNIRWAEKGLCAECVKEKEQEWTEEQETVWNMMDVWLDLKKKIE